MTKKTPEHTDHFYNLKEIKSLFRSSALRGDIATTLRAEYELNISSLAKHTWSTIFRTAFETVGLALPNLPWVLFRQYRKWREIVGHRKLRQNKQIVYEDDNAVRLSVAAAYMVAKQRKSLEIIWASIVGIEYGIPDDKLYMYHQRGEVLTGKTRDKKKPREPIKFSDTRWIVHVCDKDDFPGKRRKKEEGKRRASEDEEERETTTTEMALARSYEQDNMPGSGEDDDENNGDFSGTLRSNITTIKQIDMTFTIHAFIGCLEACKVAWSEYALCKYEDIHDDGEDDESESKRSARLRDTLDSAVETERNLVHLASVIFMAHSVEKRSIHGDVSVPRCISTIKNETMAKEDFEMIFGSLKTQDKYRNIASRIIFMLISELYETNNYPPEELVMTLLSCAALINTDIGVERYAYLHAILAYVRDPVLKWKKFDDSYVSSLCNRAESEAIIARYHKATKRIDRIRRQGESGRITDMEKIELVYNFILSQRDLVVPEYALGITTLRGRGYDTRGFFNDLIASWGFDPSAWDEKEIAKSHGPGLCLATVGKAASAKHNEAGSIASFYLKKCLWIPDDRRSADVVSIYERDAMESILEHEEAHSSYDILINKEDDIKIPAINMEVRAYRTWSSGIYGENKSVIRQASTKSTNEEDMNEDGCSMLDDKSESHGVSDNEDSAFLGGEGGAPRLTIYPQWYVDIRQKRKREEEQEEQQQEQISTRIERPLFSDETRIRRKKKQFLMLGKGVKIGIMAASTIGLYANSPLLRLPGSNKRKHFPRVLIPIKSVMIGPYDRSNHVDMDEVKKILFRSELITERWAIDHVVPYNAVSRDNNSAIYLLADYPGAVHVSSSSTQPETSLLTPPPSSQPKEATQSSLSQDAAAHAQNRLVKTVKRAKKEDMCVINLEETRMKTADTLKKNESTLYSVIRSLIPILMAQFMLGCGTTIGNTMVVNTDTMMFAPLELGEDRHTSPEDASDVVALLFSRIPGSDISAAVRKVFTMYRNEYETIANGFLSETTIFAMKDAAERINYAGCPSESVIIDRAQALIACVKASRKRRRVEKSP